MEDVASYYRENTLDRGEQELVNGWNSLRSQQRRFKVASEEMGIRPGDTVLDIGCGTAELRKYLWANGHNVEYMGIDITMEMVYSAIANGAYAIRRDILHEPLGQGPFDHVFAIGTLGVVPGSTDEERFDYVFRFVEAGLDYSTKSFAFNLLTDRSGETGTEPWFAPFDQVVTKVYEMLDGLPVVLRTDHHVFDALFVVKHGAF